MNSISPNLNLMIKASEKASKILIRDFGEVEKLQVSLKGPNNFVTNADRKVEKIIIEELEKSKKNFSILTEESVVEWKNRKDWIKYWLIDPLDGTKEFINRNGEFTVNISLIENNYPIFGIIYSPVKSLLYYALKNYGCYKLKTNSNLSTLKNFNKINIHKEKNIPTKVIGSRSHSSKEFLNWVEKKFAQRHQKIAISYGRSSKKSNNDRPQKIMGTTVYMGFHLFFF